MYIIKYILKNIYNIHASSLGCTDIKILSQNE